MRGCSILLCSTYHVTAGSNRRGKSIGAGAPCAFRTFHRTVDHAVRMISTILKRSTTYTKRSLQRCAPTKFSICGVFLFLKKKTIQRSSENLYTYTTPQRPQSTESQPTPEIDPRQARGKNEQTNGTHLPKESITTWYGIYIKIYYYIPKYARV